MKYLLCKKNKNFSYLKNKGFTLIELLIVIAIVGILASVVLASLSTSRQKADDIKRSEDLKAMQIAIETYGEKTKYDYASLLSSLPSGNHSLAECNLFDGVAKKLVSLGFLAKVPVDPQDKSAGPTCYHMWTGDDASTGTILAAYAIQWQKYQNLAGNKKIGFLAIGSGSVFDAAELSCAGTSYPLFNVSSNGYGDCINTSNQTADQVMGVVIGR